MSESNYYNFQSVLEKVPANIESIVRELFPEGKKKGGNWAVGDETGAKGQSFQISLSPQSAGCYIDRSDPSIRGNPIALVALRQNVSYQDAGAWLAKYCGVQPEERVFQRKKRAKPQIDRTQIQKLQPSSIKYAESRGIKEETLRQLKCASSDGAIIFSHFTFDDPKTPCLLKFWPVDGSKRMWTNKDPIHTLFGKELVCPIKSGGTLIITEGHWDAMTWIQLGYPAVSIPSGCQNDDWIEEDYVFLNQFTTIFLDFDADAAGIEAENRVKLRLGHEKVRIIRYDHKDANEVLQGGHDTACLTKAYEDARDAPVEHIVKAEDLRHTVKDHLSGGLSEVGIPFFLGDMKQLRFRPHENTLWFGHSGHGKSTAIMNQFAYQAGLGYPGLIASFEDTTSVTYSNLLLQYSANPFIGASEQYDEYFDKLAEKIHLFDSMKRTSPKELVSTFILAHKQLGICDFAIDNVMTMDVDRQDNTAQAAVADQIRIFVSSYPVRMHIAAHPRKAQEGHIIRPPQLSEVRGASEWGDMSQNAVVVYRDMAKAERIAQMIDEKMSPQTIMEYRLSCMDGKFIVRKQRTTGDLPTCSFNFDPRVKRFWRDMGDQGPYYTAGGKEEEPPEPPF